MDINRFTAELVSRLRNAGADEAAANRHARAFVGSLPEKEAAAVAAHADDEGVMRQIADRIMVRINKEAESRAQEAPPSPPEDDDGFEGDDDMIAAMLADPGDGDAQGEQPPQPQPPQPRETPLPPQARQPERDPRQAQPRQAMPQTPTPAPTPQAHDGERQQPRGQAGAQRPPQKQPNGGMGASRPAPRKNPDERKTPRSRRPIYKPDPNADYRKFYIIFGCTAPIWGLAALFLALLFIFAYAALAAAIVILIVGLFAGVAVGVVLAVVGIIYGITQLFELQPVGMYEIGLGIMIGGFVMFGGIIAYNGAVRLLPFLIKELSVLLSFTIHKCVELYYYVKGRCADL